MGFERQALRTDIWTPHRVEQLFEVLRRLLSPPKTYTTNQTLSGSNNIALFDATSAAITVTLPKAALHNSRVYSIKKTDSSANAVTVTPDGSETIDGAASYALSAQWKSLTIVSDGTQWLILGAI